MKPYFIILFGAIFSFTGCGPSSKSVSIEPSFAFSDTKQKALAEAAEAGDCDKIEAAVKLGANVNAVGEYKLTALWYAFTSQRKKAFKRLLELGADPNTLNQAGDTLVGACLMIDDLDYLKLTLAHGGNPNAINASRDEPIIFSAITYAKSNEKIDLLIKGSANLNIRSSDGSTAIIYASSVRQMETVKFLIEKGADPFLRDNNGLDIAVGLFGPNWDKSSQVWEIRCEVIKILEEKFGVSFDTEAIEKAEIRNLGEASGKEIPMQLRSKSGLNPEWVNAHPKEAAEWYKLGIGKSEIKSEIDK